MLINLHVHDFALIKDADLELGPGLNILTGETGAGKSILIDAVNAALGGRMRKDAVRDGSCRIDLAFSVEKDSVADALNKLGISAEDGTVILSRRVTGGHSLFRINDEAATASRVREAAEVLIDIHGQQENASLCKASRQLELVDRFAGEEDALQREAVAKAFKRRRECLAELGKFSADEEQRRREQDLLEFETEEIRAAAIKEGEEEELTALYKRYSNSRKLTELLGEADEEISGSEGAGEALARAIRRILQAAAIDEGLSEVASEFEGAEEMLTGAARSLGDYIRGLEFDPADLARVEERLDLIHRMERKYGRTAADIDAALRMRLERLDELRNFEERKAEAEAADAAALAELERLSEKLSALRREAAGPLEKSISAALADLGFLSSEFEIAFSDTESITDNGSDEVEYRISANPGEPLLPVAQIASGGELSRIMLAMKAVLADRDEIPTLIFDEIDAGISGRTAQKVSEKLHVIAKHRQVICITHLPQIAAMADRHFQISKAYDGDSTKTHIRELEGDEVTEELARLLGGAELTETVFRSAVEMKELADKIKREK